MTVSLCHYALYLKDSMPVRTHTDTCENNLSDTLCDCGLQLQSVPPDGNCFFTSIALNMLSDLQV